MYDSYIVKRTQIYLDDTQDIDLARRAAAEVLSLPVHQWLERTDLERVVVAMQELLSDR